MLRFYGGSGGSSRLPQCAPPATVVLFGLAAGAGALLRWQAGRRLPRPLATLAINVVGAFALGLLSGPTLFRPWSGSGAWAR